MNLPARLSTLPADHRCWWCRRYLPSGRQACWRRRCSVCWRCGPRVSRWATTAAVAGEGFAYYGVIFGRETRWRACRAGRRYRCCWCSSSCDLLLEFGPAAADTLLVRRSLIYGLNLVPVAWLGIALGKLAADFFFYVPTIVIFEMRQGARRLRVNACAW